MDDVTVRATSRSAWTWCAELPLVRLGRGGIARQGGRRFRRWIRSPLPTGALGERGRTAIAGFHPPSARGEKPSAKDALNILIILLDDVGFGLPDTYGGPVHTPALSRIANEGISYNTFHTTAICSPTRAALLTGCVGSGTVAERAVDWDGYTGVIPRTSAKLAKVLGEYGYKTAAFGKWHNTPATEQRPWRHSRDGRPAGVGFDYFYGFLAGETSQWEPRLYENFNPMEPPHDPKYHLSEDLADKAITWMNRHRAFSPDKPFFMYWAPGAAHGLHHIFKEWADKYKGRFDDGWDELRERRGRHSSRNQRTGSRLGLPPSTP